MPLRTTSLPIVARNLYSYTFGSNSIFYERIKIINHCNYITYHFSTSSVRGLRWPKNCKNDVIKTRVGMIACVILHERPHIHAHIHTGTYNIVYYTYYRSFHMISTTIINNNIIICVPDVPYFSIGLCNIPKLVRYNILLYIRCVMCVCIQVN